MVLPMGLVKQFATPAQDGRTDHSVASATVLPNRAQHTNPNAGARMRIPLDDLSASVSLVE
jgi:hypothetical protein